MPHETRQWQIAIDAAEQGATARVRSFVRRMPLCPFAVIEETAHDLIQPAGCRKLPIVFR